MGPDSSGPFLLESNGSNSPCFSDAELRHRLRIPPTKPGRLAKQSHGLPCQTPMNCNALRGSSQLHKQQMRKHHGDVRQGFRRTQSNRCASICCLRHRLGTTNLKTPGVAGGARWTVRYAYASSDNRPPLVTMKHKKPNRECVSALDPQTDRIDAGGLDGW